MAPKYCDYYKVLGVARDATAEDIHEAFRRLARKYHPDVNPDKKAEEKFKTISEAYEVLSDPTKRARFDSLGRQWRPGQEFVPPEGYGAGEPARRRGKFSDFFYSLFGGGFAPNFAGMETGPPPTPPPAAPLRGADIETEISITLEQAYQGARTTVAVRAGGTGNLAGMVRKYDVKIPAGIRDGARIRLAGQGRPADKKGLPPGDLFIRVRIAPHPVFRLRGDDIESDLAIAPWEAALGGKISVPTLDGAVEMSLPPGSQSGRRMRLRGKGMPKSDGPRGDHYVVLKIVVPESLTDRERELFEQLARESAFQPRK